MVEPREKASDLFRNSEPAFDKKVPFEEAFPTLKDLKVEVQETSRGSEFQRPPGKTVYDRTNLPGEYVDCKSRLCYGGGFSLGAILRKMIREKQIHLEDGPICWGQEGGRKIYRHCMSSWDVKVDLVYKTETPPEQGTSENELKSAPTPDTNPSGC